MNYLVKWAAVPGSCRLAQQDVMGTRLRKRIKAIRSLEPATRTILRLSYQRNTVDDEAVAQLDAETQRRFP